MIDTDIHVLIDPEQLLGYVDPAQREWFRSRGLGLGLPDCPWAHPVSWFRDDAEHETDGAPTTSVGAIQRQVLDAYSVDIGILNAADGLAIPLMPSAYRAAALARAHNDWLRDHYLDQDPRLRGAIVCPAQDSQAAAEEIRRCAEDKRFGNVGYLGDGLMV